MRWALFAHNTSVSKESNFASGIKSPATETKFPKRA